jgi:DNA-binding MarR family transcriptional regulator
MAQGAEGPRFSYVIGRLHRVLRSTLDQRIRKHGITVAQYAALSILAQQPGLSNAQLARRSFMSAQSANQVLLTLCELGLVRRKPNPLHARISPTELTARGRSVLKACERIVDEAERTMLKKLASEPQKRLLADLRTCLKTLEASRAGERGAKKK